jgi:sodium transport system permease protein
VRLEDIGVSVHMGTADAALVLALVLPLCLLGAALQLLVATFARSFREAQTYLSIMMLAPMLPEMFMTMNPVQPQPWMAAVPVLSQHVLVTGVLRGDAVAAWQVAVAAAVPLVLALVVLRVTAWLFSREKIVFGS